MFLLMWLLKINAACKTHVVLVLGSTGLDHPTLEGSFCASLTACISLTARVMQLLYLLLPPRVPPSCLPPCRIPSHSPGSRPRVFYPGSLSGRHWLRGHSCPCILSLPVIRPCWPPGQLVCPGSLADNTRTHVSVQP